ncbi:MAG: hypothetical protein IKA51_00485 [Clostridia bacterium]|nr:hypothetical protein [Clostridia bacterium]
MRILIAGSRTITDVDIAKYMPEDAELIICGGAKGIDSVAEQYADKNRISKLILRPQYKLYGKAAPLKRNEKMVDLADFVLIFWDGHSRGTKHTAEYAKKMNKVYKIVMFPPP